MRESLPVVPPALLLAALLVAVPLLTLGRTAHAAGHFIIDERAVVG